MKLNCFITYSELSPVDCNLACLTCPPPPCLTCPPAALPDLSSRRAAQSGLSPAALSDLSSPPPCLTRPPAALSDLSSRRPV